MTASILLEIAIASVEDALTAHAGGADRLELNAALALGGLTPSLGTLIEVKQAVARPVMVMIRPRRGGFCYSAADFRVMQRDIDLSLAHGADGIVLGVLTAEGRIDLVRCEQLIRQTGSYPIVFHRAFDVTPDPFVALEQLIDLGVRRVMTSGQEVSAYNGTALIAELIRRAAGRIEVLPAAGINRFTVADVVARTGCNQVHASLRGRRTDRSTVTRPHVSFSASSIVSEEQYSATDAAAIAEMRMLLGNDVS
ncbi:MAG TPA: copper homeostasis protein CutC [Gemmataceae bacterium]|nr:copper homeostasis protein CutC [Gemmataceae bacterium]